MTFGPIRPPSRGTLDVVRLAEVGALRRYRPHNAPGEATGARAWIIGFAFGAVCCFAAIAWLATGVARL